MKKPGDRDGGTEKRKGTCPAPSSEDANLEGISGYGDRAHNHLEELPGKTI